MAELICPITGVAVSADGKAIDGLLAAGYILAAGAVPAEVQAADIPEVVHPMGEKPDLESMKLRELAAWCKANGIQTKRGWVKADYVDAINARF